MQLSYGVLLKETLVLEMHKKNGQVDIRFEKLENKMQHITNQLKKY